MKVGITFGAFDLLHAGHAEFLLSAGEYVDQLVVGLHVDPSVERPHKNKPIQSVLERFWQLRSIRKVDAIVPYESEKDIEQILGITSGLTHYFVGEDHRGDKITGEFISVIKGISIRYIPRHHTYSTTELRQRIYNHEAKLFTPVSIRDGVHS